MLRPEPLDLILILLIGLLLFGANRIPETARAMGKALREFRDAVSGKEEPSVAAPKEPAPNVAPRESAPNVARDTT